MRVYFSFDYKGGNAFLGMKDRPMMMERPLNISTQSRRRKSAPTLHLLSRQRFVSGSGRKL